MAQCGIGSIINKSSGKLYIFKSRDLIKSGENYHALLNANYHHNSELQDDWNELGHNNFVFEIKEITDDNEEIMNQKLNEYLQDADKIYSGNDFNDVPFNYKTKILLDELYYIIGETQINPIFLNKLSINNIEENYYNQIKEDAEKAIRNGEVKIGEVDKLLDNLINAIVENKAIELKNKKEGSLNELYNLTGKTKLTKKYLQLLDKNGLSKEIGLEIKNEIIDLINNDTLDSSVKDKFNELIDEKKQIEDKKIEDDLISQLHELTGKLDLTEAYVKKLQSKGLTPETGFIIRQNIKKQIQEGKFRDDSLEEILNDALDEECERLAVENENKLIDYLDNTIGKTNLCSQFKSKLDVFNLKYSIGFEIKKEIHDLIKNREITEESEIDSKIDELIEIEVINETKIKDELFKQLHDMVGEKQLNDEFKSKLDLYNIEEEWGISLLNSLEEDISTHKISQGFDFKNYIDKSIIDKKESDLTNQLNCVFEDKMFDAKINKNFLNDKDSEEIKSELMNIIKSRDIDAMIALENNTVEKEVNNRIFERHDNIKDEVLDIRENLLGDLYVVVNEEYVPKVDSGLIREEIVDKTKKYLEEIIKQDHISDSKFKYKIDELRDLNNKTVKGTFKSLIDEEKRIEKVEFDKLRAELKEDLSLLFNDSSTSFINLKLKEYDLPQRYASKTEKRIIQIIDSNDVCDNKFKFKMDELKYYKVNSFKDEIIKILEEFKAIIDKKLNQLYAITGKDTLNESFKNLLTNKGLNEKAGRKIISEFKEDILNEKPISNIEVEINNRLNQMEIDKNEAYELLENKVGTDASKFFFSARLGKRNLDADIHGMAIKQNIETLIQSGEVNSKNFDDVLSKELDNEVIRKKDRLKEQVGRIIGLDKLNQSFLTDISKYNLTEEDAISIRSDILNDINNNKLEENEAEEKINKLIINKGNLKTKELLTKKVNTIIGEESINSEFSQKLTYHDLDNSDGHNIRNNIIHEINKGNITFDNLEDSIELELEFLDKHNVKNELDKLSGDSINSIMKKHSIRGILPLKAAKISKLLDNVSLTDLKTDLAECGVGKYKIKYGSGFSKESFDNGNNNFCANCGAKLDKGAVFCSSCGKKVEY